MKCIISYNQIVVKSDCTAEEFEHARKLNPENTVLRDDKDKLIYAIAYDPDSTGDVSQHGITFNSTNSEGFMYTALYGNLENATIAEKKEAVKEKLAIHIRHIEEIERNIKGTASAYDTLLNDAESKIIVMED